MRNVAMRRAPTLAFILVMALGTQSRSIAQLPTSAASSKLPDILGIYTGMSAQDAYALIMAHDSLKRVKVGQVAIPELLGDKPAIYAMAPDTLDDQDELYTNLTFPPNAQQVWEVHRVLSGIPTTKEQIIASLRQKYGPENKISANADSLLWIYDERGGLSTLSPADLNTCSQTLGSVILLNVPITGPDPGISVLHGSATILTTIPPFWDPVKFPQCQSQIWVRAIIVGRTVAGIHPNYELDILISDYALQRRSAFVLNDFYKNLADKQQQQDLNKAKQQPLPKL
jgi:hypothetical protein